MYASTILIYSGPITYISIWILYFIVTIFFDISEQIKNALFIYALIPFGAVTQSAIGSLFYLLGL
jgi:hypothetical protein